MPARLAIVGENAAPASVGQPVDHFFGDAGVNQVADPVMRVGAALAKREVVDLLVFEFVDDAFGDLSTTRQIGAITSVGVGLGLYIWNIIDARSSSRAYNKKVIQRRIDLGMIASDDQTGLALNFRF